jgi:hypothetical protein
MINYLKYIVVGIGIVVLIGCSKEKDETSKTSFQILADKEKELNDREARLKLKEIEIEEREKKLNVFDKGYSDIDNPDLTQLTKHQQDSVKKLEKEVKQKTKKEIQKEITTKFENPSSTVKDYYEYIQRGINETGNFDSNMKKAQKYFPSRPVDKLKSGYRNTKEFTVVEEPKVLSQKDDKASVVAKVKQKQVVQKDGKDTEVTKTLTVTYNLNANKSGEWVIVSNTVKEE